MGIRLASGMYRITSLSSSSYVYRGRHRSTLIMYKGSIMYATQKRKLFRYRADSPPSTGTQLW